MSSPDVVDDFVDSNSRTLAPAAVGSQVLLMSGVSLITVLVFNLLRPRNKIVYEPKVKYHVGNKQPPKISDSMFGWLPPVIHTKEPELLDKIGLDAVAFLRFLRMLRWLFLGVAVIACGMLLPVNLIYNQKNVDPRARDILSMLTVRDVQGSSLFVHVAATYLFTFFVIGIVWLNWKQMVVLRSTFFRSPEYMESFYARTLMVMKVPKSYQSDEGIRNILQSMQVPYPATSVHIGRRVGRLPELIEFHNDAVRKLEQVLVKYLKDGKIGKKRPTLTKGGFLGMGGTKHDAIDFYTNKLKRAEAAINEYRQEIDHRKPENYGFASMAAVPYTHIVARMLADKRPKGTTVTLAPNPKDIIWENLNKSPATLARKRTIGWLYLVLVCFVNTVPLLAVSFLANLAAITAYVPFLEEWARTNETSFAIISGVLPPAVAAFFGWFLPVTMRWLSRYQGATTRSRLDRAVVARYFAFLMISQLFIFTLIGVIFNSVREIVDQIGKHKSFQEILSNLDKLPRIINRTYIDQANFWLTFFPLRGFLAVFDLAQILNLIWIWFKTKLFGRTPRDIREWTQPPDFEYAIYYSNILYMAAVGLVFAPLAPLVPAAAAIVFWMSSFVYKYQLMFVFVSKVESGGRLWNVVINRLLWTVVFMQSLMVLTIGLQRGWETYQWVSTIPPIFLIMGFKIYINREFLPKFRWYIPTEEEIHMAKVYSERADARGGRLGKRFGHPALHAELFTPMLHAGMMPLLPEVYNGRLKSESTTVDEYGGQKMQASVIPGGIKIAGISQNDLEYDPALYQRDRGELDWDQRSISSMNALADPSSMQQSKAQFYQGGNTAPRHLQLAGYDQYMARGSSPTPVTPGSEIELSRFDHRTDQQPLLGAPPAPGGYFDPAQSSRLSLQYAPQNVSQQSLPAYTQYGNPAIGRASPAPSIGPQQPPGVSPGPGVQYPPSMQRGYTGEREAPLHRPPPQQRYAGMDNSNLAGRGTGRQGPY